MPTIKLDKKQFTGLLTFQNINKFIAIILTLFTTFAFLDGEYKVMLVFFSGSLLVVSVLAVIDYALRTKNFKNEIPSPFLDVLNKQTVNQNQEKSRSEVQGANKPKDKEQVPKTDQEIVSELKGSLNKNTNQTQKPSTPNNPNNSGNRKSKKDFADLFEDKNKPTFAGGSVKGSNGNMNDVFLKEEGKDDDRLL